MVRPATRRARLSPCRARVHNLKNISVEIPRDRLIVVIGLGQVEPDSLAGGAGTQGAHPARRATELGGLASRTSGPSGRAGARVPRDRGFFHRIPASPPVSSGRATAPRSGCAGACSRDSTSRRYANGSIPRSLHVVHRLISVAAVLPPSSLPAVICHDIWHCLRADNDERTSRVYR